MILTTYQVLKWKSWDKNARSHGCLDPSQPLESLEQLVNLFWERSLRSLWHRDENRVDGCGQAGCYESCWERGRDH